jgi:hypothetical protein
VAVYLVINYISLPVIAMINYSLLTSYLCPGLTHPWRVDTRWGLYPLCIHMNSMRLHETEKPSNGKGFSGVRTELCIAPASHIGSYV